MPGTALKVYPRCYVTCKGDGVVVPLQPGHAIIFRGDLTHCGMSYPQLNYRLHCYMTLPDKAWTPDVVSSAATRVFECQYCKKGYKSVASARQHRYKCTKSPDFARNLATRRAREQGQFPCEFCEHTPFSSRGDLRNHRFKALK